MRKLAVAFLALQLASACAFQPKLHENPKTRKNLERTRLVAKIGVAIGVALIAGASLATYKTATMCDDSPDPADDCGIVKGLATAGTIAFWGLAAVTTGGSAVMWAISSSELEARDRAAAPEP